MVYTQHTQQVVLKIYHYF